MTDTGKRQPHAGRGNRFFYGYVLVAASFLMQAIGWGAYNSFGVFFNPLMNEYTWSRAGISGAVSVSFCVYGLSSILLGRLNDRMGPRFIMGYSIDRIGNKWALTICYGFLCVSLGWLLLANRLWMLFVFATVYGFAHGGFFVIMSPLIAEFFGTASHGAIFGMMIFASTIGGAIGPLAAGYVFDLTGSYRVVFWCLPLISTAGLGATLMLRSPVRG